MDIGSFKEKIEVDFDTMYTSVPTKYCYEHTSIIKVNTFDNHVTGATNRLNKTIIDKTNNNVSFINVCDIIDSFCDNCYF